MILGIFQPEYDEKTTPSTIVALLLATTAVGPSDWSADTADCTHYLTSHNNVPFIVGDCFKMHFCTDCSKQNRAKTPLSWQTSDGSLACQPNHHSPVANREMNNSVTPRSDDITAAWGNESSLGSFSSPQGVPYPCSFFLRRCIVDSINLISSILYCSITDITAVCALSW